MSKLQMPRELTCILNGEVDAVYNLANIIRDSTKTNTLLALYGFAFDAGVEEAALNLGTYLADKGRSSEAIEWFTKAYDTGDTRAAMAIAQEYKELGDYERALQWYRRAKDIPEGAVGYSKIARKLGLEDEALHILLEHADHQGDAAVELVVRFEKLTPEESFDLLQQHWSQGHYDVGVTFGNLLSELGRVEDAISVYTAAAHSGDSHAAFNLGIELLLTDPVEATEWIRQARDGGSKKAKKWLKNHTEI
ncbi:tetratricopeptide repeat protein [Jonesia quinghaiensis]|uniref:tetratricopeptide repeat protein n=1 Tax=Jonesia quinghaiensis TaxID=262806 RepID=UPI000A040147|nr:tetratricopeptide repeat protein [Jonesia quinghaiensis]